MFCILARSLQQHENEHGLFANQVYHYSNSISLLFHKVCAPDDHSQDLNADWFCVSWGQLGQPVAWHFPRWSGKSTFHQGSNTRLVLIHSGCFGAHAQGYRPCWGRSMGANKTFQFLTLWYWCSTLHENYVLSLEAGAVLCKPWRGTSTKGKLLFPLYPTECFWHQDVWVFPHREILQFLANTEHPTVQLKFCLELQPRTLRLRAQSHKRSPNCRHQVPAVTCMSDSLALWSIPLIPSSGLTICQNGLQNSERTFTLTGLL